MPRRDVPQTLLAVFALLVTLALVLAPAVDAQAKGKRDEAATESRRAERHARRDEGAGRSHRERSRDRPRRERNRSRDATAAEMSAPWLPADDPNVDDPYINEELIAAAAAAGEIYDPEPPPIPQRAWDEEAADAIAWEPVARIDAGLTGDESPLPVPGSAQPADDAAGNSPFTHGWTRTALPLQEALADDSPPSEDGADEQQPESDDAASDEPAPVPVEDGVVTDGVSQATDSDAENAAGDSVAEVEPLDDAVDTPRDDARREERPRAEQAAREEPGGTGASTRRDTASAPESVPDEQRARTRASRRAGKERGRLGGWSSDRDFSGGSAVALDAGLDVAGTNDDALYLTQRTGSGTGDRRGFSYAIPVNGNGTYLVRFYFAEPYWGVLDGPDSGDGQRIFSVTGEGETVLADLDIYAEAGPLTALVKESEIEVSDGELNLHFAASAGEPLVAAIEVLAPAS